MNKRMVGIFLTIKMILVAFFGVPILFALYQIRKLARNNPKEKPAKPFYE